MMRLMKILTLKKMRVDRWHRDDIAFYQSGRGGEAPNLRYYIQCPDGSLEFDPNEEKNEGLK